MAANALHATNRYSSPPPGSHAVVAPRRAVVAAEELEVEAVEEAVRGAMARAERASVLYLRGGYGSEWWLLPDADADDVM